MPIAAYTKAQSESPDCAVLHHLLTPTAAQVNVIDIRSRDTALLDGLDSSILQGLSQPHGHKFLPSLLLWDEKGHRLYNEVLAAKEYYPYWVENELFRERVDEMAGTIAASGPNLVIELGAGNMSKTARFLCSLDKHLGRPLVYYALDVDRAQLEQSLALLQKRTDLRWIRVCGLLGTYDDGARWLARPDAAALRKALVWLGSSIANYEQHEASELLESFRNDPETSAPQNIAGFLLVVDGCQDATRIELAYDVPGGRSRRWILHAVEAARRRLRNGSDDAEVGRLLADESWRFEGQWHPERQRFDSYLVPSRRLAATIRGRRIRLEKGERVRIIGSGKWMRETLSSVASKPGLEVRRSWHNSEFNYGAYWLQPCIKRHDSAIDMAEISGDAPRDGNVQTSTP